MKINSNKLGVLILIIFLGGIITTMAINIWTTTTAKEPIKYTSGEFAGEYNPEDIRGSYTFAEVSELFGIDVQVLLSAFGVDLDTDPTQFKIKDLETIYNSSSVEIGNESVQAFIGLYKGFPLTLTESYLPTSAIKILKELPTEWTEEQLLYFEQYSIELSSIESESKPGDIGEDVNNNQQISSLELENTDEMLTVEDGLVKGNTTFQQVRDMGISDEKIIEIIGDKMPPANQVIKDYCLNNGISFSEVKEKLNAIK